ncbi:calpain-9-like isoform X2 [Lineus longissimus]|uniref:calpain-9-like isoform X2 n=1 Tax=Lineus longissimus TaxID=88925 RepID=UPI00315C6470
MHRQYGQRPTPQPTATGPAFGVAGGGGVGPPPAEPSPQRSPMRDHGQNMNMVNGHVQGQVPFGGSSVSGAAQFQPEFSGRMRTMQDLGPGSDRRGGGSDGSVHSPHSPGMRIQGSLPREREHREMHRNQDPNFHSDLSERHNYRPGPDGDFSSMKRQNPARPNQSGMEPLVPPTLGLSGSVEAPPVGNDFEGVRLDCLRRRMLYEDPEFPAADKSIYFSRHPPNRFEWLRPGEILRHYRGLKPELFVGGASRFDLKQGKLGDCWVIAALASISENMELVYNLIPRGQSFHPDWYAGMFRFQFWQAGTWQEVVIDDRLPAINGQLAFVHSNSPNEFWGALIEKAYAKLFGSYEAIKGGQIADALTDFTGGLTESYLLTRPNTIPRNIVNIMFKALERQSVIGAGINATGDRSGGETILPNGLAGGHAYSITDMREIRIPRHILPKTYQGKEIRLISDRGEVPITLVRIRNPWGSRIEWNGPWSDRSPEWNSIPEDQRRAMGLVFRDDGEFWMDFRDFLDNFHSLDICNMPPESNVMASRQWTSKIYHSKWVKGVTAGGRPSAKETHWMNPQFKVILKDSDDDEDNSCSFLVELMQIDKRRMKNKNAKNVDIGFVIYKCVKDFPVPLPRKYFDYFGYVERCDYYSNSRQNVKRFLMEPGEYVVIPSTFEPNQETSFMLRFFFEKENQTEPIDENVDVDIPDPVTDKDPDIKNKEAEFKRFFYDVSGEDMEISAFEFHQVLNNALHSEPNHREISLGSCKAMVALMDVDYSGRLGYNEFIYLWNVIKTWKQTFLKSDRDNSGFIDTIELRNAVASLGYKVSVKVLGSMIFKFADETDRISLDSFIMCMARLMQLSNIYHNQKKKAEGVFSLEEFLHNGMLV